VKLGILEADQLDKAIQDQYGSYSEMFQELFSAVDDQLVFQSYDIVHLEYPDSMAACDAYLITGSKASTYEDKPWIRRLENEVHALHTRRKKLIGICFGHQLIAQALGGKVQKSEEGWGVGMASRRVFLEKSWMGKMEDSYRILVSHQDQVTQLPPGAELIAGNEFCPNASFQMGRHILSFQGHPEFQPNYLRQLIAGRREIIGPLRADQALKSLEKKTDHLQIARWIVAFLKSPIGNL